MNRDVSKRSVFDASPVVLIIIISHDYAIPYLLDPYSKLSAEEPGIKGGGSLQTSEGTVVAGGGAKRSETRA